MLYFTKCVTFLLSGSRITLTLYLGANFTLYCIERQIGHSVTSLIASVSLWATLIHFISFMNCTKDISFEMIGFVVVVVVFVVIVVVVVISNLIIAYYCGRS